MCSGRSVAEEEDSRVDPDTWMTYSIYVGFCRILCLQILSEPGHLSLLAASFMSCFMQIAPYTGSRDDQ